MSRLNSPSSNNSGTSSETSETQSVEENSKFFTNLTPENFEAQKRGSQSWKRMKEIGGNQSGDAENKRPPWRAVSVSTLPKPDKNAILRAKLLDASRRLRAGKSSIGLQANLELTKLLKDVNLGTQTDLVLYKDIGILTDGFYTKKINNGDEFILTYSVSQMTDTAKVSDATTQTLIPRFTGDIFLKKYFADNSGMKEQVTNPNRNLIQPTLLSWNFDYGEVNNDDNTSKFVPYIIQANRTSQNFSPLPRSSLSNIRFTGYDWNLFLLSIDVLLEETNKLLDIIEEQIAARQTYNTTLLHTNGLDSIEERELIIPSEKWLPVIEEEEKILAEMITNL